MKKKDQIISDDIITYKLNLIKFGNKTVREVLQMLNSLESDILKQLDTVELAEWKKSRLNKTLKEIGETTTKYYNQIAETVGADLLPVPAAAQSAVNGALSSTMGAEFTAIASPARLELLASNAIIQGAPNKAWWSKQDNDLKFKIQNTLRQGYAQGIGTRAVARDVRDAMRISKRHTETLVRTSFMTVSNDALMQTYKDSDAVDSVEWTSTLDSRTCKYCMAMDGRKYKVDAVKPEIPAHMNCRCIYAPVTKTWRQMGFDVDELTPARRDMDGIVEGDTSFDGFLKRKGVKFQDDMLGKGRADLWRDGKINISDLVNQRGSELSLKELQVRTGTSN